MGSLSGVSGVRSVAKVAAQRVYARWRRMPLKDVVLLESYEGTARNDNPAAIAEYLLAHTELPLVWALRQPLPIDEPRVSTVKYRSSAYFKALATSRFLVNNVTFPPLFDKRDDQVYLNTWHGTPLKRMGRDVAGPYGNIANTVANLRCADIVLSSGHYMTHTMYEGAYGVGGANVAELGSPRVDVQFREQPERDLVFYAPTWQEQSYTDAADDLDDVAERMQAISRAVPEGLRPALRVHSKLARAACEHPRLAGFLPPPELSTNELLSRTQVLITDYSSVAFDFLATGSQVAFFTPVAYPRGVYLSDEELPGPRTASVETLQRWLREGLPGAPVPVEKARRRFCPDEDGSATQRVVERLLRA